MNYEPKSIFLFLVDVSSNVDDQHLIKANLFIETFAQYAINDKMLQNRVIVGIIEFDVDARVIQSPQLAGDVPSIISGDSPVSNLFKAISTSLVLLRDVKDDLISHGQSFKRPRIIILSDGKCDDDAYMPLYKESLVHAKQNNSYEVIRSCPIVS